MGISRMTQLSLASRMKRYEQAQALHLTRRIPVIIRVDGRAFHTLTRHMSKPYDLTLINAMVTATSELARSMDGCRLAYVQSDEASFLLTDFARLESEAWFGYDLQKVVSLAAAGMTARFNRAMTINVVGASSVSISRNQVNDDVSETTALLTQLKMPIAEFDARAFNLPHSEVANYFLWRARDWHRNSVLMYAQAHFCHKQLHGKKLPDIHEMLHSIGRNWATDTSEVERNGTFVTTDDNIMYHIVPTYESVNTIVQMVMPTEENQ